MKHFHVSKVLVNGVCSACIPLGIRTFFVRRQDAHTTDIAVQIPGYADADMRIKTQRLVLRQNTYRIYPGIDTVA